MSKFKIGDKVRIKKGQSEINRFVGTIGTVNKVHEPSQYHDWFCAVTIDDDNPRFAGKYNFALDEVELVVEPKFKIGDRVRIVAPGNWFDGKLGKIGVISGKEAGTLLDGNSTYNYFFLSEIELVEDPAPEKLAVGDKVRVSFETTVTHSSNAYVTVRKGEDVAVFPRAQIELLERAVPPRVPAPGEIWEDHIGNQYVILSDPAWCKLIGKPTFGRSMTSYYAKKFVA